MHHGPWHIWEFNGTHRLELVGNVFDRVSRVGDAPSEGVKCGVLGFLDRVLSPLLELAVGRVQDRRARRGRG